MNLTELLPLTARVERLDPRPWQAMVDRMRGLDFFYALPEHGPWEDEPDEVQWSDPDTGYSCWLKRGPTGGWNGYVCVPVDHRWWGKEYGDEELEEVEVHGGLTFSAMWLAEGDWWLGFDCAHGFDTVPAMMEFPGSRYRTVSYAIGQVTSLAHQVWVAK